MEALTTTAKFGATAQGVIKRIDELDKEAQARRESKNSCGHGDEPRHVRPRGELRLSCRAGPPDVQRAHWRLRSCLPVIRRPQSRSSCSGWRRSMIARLGDLPEGAAKAYGDYAFVRMMCVCGVPTCFDVAFASTASLIAHAVDATPSPRRHRRVDPHAGGSRSRPSTRW